MRSQRTVDLPVLPAGCMLAGLQPCWAVSLLAGKLQEGRDRSGLTMGHLSAAARSIHPGSCPGWTALWP